MTSFENVVMINRPRETVFAYLAELENVPRWNPAIVITEKTTPGPVGVGTAYRQVRSAPERAEEHFEIVAFDPPARLTLDGEIGRFQAMVSYTLEEIRGATLLTNWVTLEAPSVMSRVVLPLAIGQVRAAVSSNLDRLKRILETS